MPHGGRPVTSSTQGSLTQTLSTFRFSASKETTAESGAPRTTYSMREHRCDDLSEGVSVLGAVGPTGRGEESVLQDVATTVTQVRATPRRAENLSIVIDD